MFKFKIYCTTVAILLLLKIIVQCHALNQFPNILFIVVDDLRPALGIYGDLNAYTPNIDAFAKKCIVFTKAYAQQALCAPSRNSFLTSRRPDTLHLYDFYSYWRNVAGNFTTLPQYLKENGYNTYSIGKVFHPGQSSNWTDDYPLSWSQPAYHPPTEIYKESPVCPDKYGHRRNLVCPVHLEFQPEQTLPDLQSLEQAKKFIKFNENSIYPYFLAVGFHKPHIPLKYPKKYIEYHPIENITIDINTNKPYGLPTVAWNPWNDVRDRNDIADFNISFPYGKMPDDWMKKIIQSYHAAVTYIDDLIGQLLKEVDKENTIVALIGDHGWSLGEHGEWSKFSNFDVATRVPFILYVPDEKPKIINTPVELIDIFPTLIDYIGLPKIPKCNKNKKLPLCTEGQSLKPLIKRKSTPVKIRYAFSQYPRPGIKPTKQPNSDKPRLKQIKIMGYTLVSEYYRYTEWVYFNHTTVRPDWNRMFGVELYAHEFDKGENINLADRSEMQQIREALSKILRKHNK